MADPRDSPNDEAQRLVLREWARAQASDAPQLTGEQAKRVKSILASGSPRSRG